MASKKQQPLSKPREQKLNRSQRREFTRRIWSQEPGLKAVHPDAGGIDIGSRIHYVAVPPDRDPQPIRPFGCFTEDLRRMAAWLKQCRITSVGAAIDWCVLCAEQRIDREG